MEKFVEQSYLYDFYGELLTKHQQRIYSSIVFDDLSEAEVGRAEGISRQGVHDLMKRAQKILEEYEARLQLVSKFLRIRSRIREIQSLTSDQDEKVENAEKAEPPMTSRDRMKAIHEIAGHILEEM